jgi:phosphoserine aminotransferase
MTERIYNFNPGPATLPLDVLKEVQEELLDYQATGMSVLEHSHRGKQVDGMHNETISLVRELGGFGDEHHVLFLGGGASSQFYMIPMNLLKEGQSADYINTGTWSTKAIKEAGVVARCKVAASTEDEGFARLPGQDELQLDPDAVYVHFTSNNTIKGTQWHTFPRTGNVPLVCDMSSDMFWRPFDPGPFGLVYAGAQKNLGPAGVTLIVIRDDMLQRCRDDIPTMISYKTHVKKSSMFNTPPVFPIYVMNRVLAWLKKNGGLAAIERINRKKADTLYSFIDGSGGFYRGTVTDPESRSFMNVTMRLPSEDLEKKLVAEGADAGFWGLKGHRSVGGIRVSMYNAMTLKGIEDLVGFLKEYKAKNG